MSDVLFYVQHTQNFAGDYMLWWRPNGCGYTFNLDEAGLYTEAEARRIEAMRGQEKAWSQDEVMPGIQRAVSIVHLRRAT
jgi:hypothetical protein